jgi:hypothetical protein
MQRAAFFLGVALSLASCTPGVSSKIEPLPPMSFLKGQTHVHSNNSGDSQTPPEEVARWYESHGYDFIVMTDHNYITSLEWRGPMLVLPGVELTQNKRSCTPPPAPGEGCILHMNALAVTETSEPQPQWPEIESDARKDIYLRALTETKRLGGVAQLNHPNFYYAADAALIAALARAGTALVEIANESIGCQNEGDEAHPSTEALWDAVLSQGATVYGVATDDAHHYYDVEATQARGETAYVGDLGWLMVRAEKRPEAIREALARGEFYSSTGVFLRAVQTNSEALSLEVEAKPGRSYRIVFIGQEGKTLAEVQGTRARFLLARAKGGYVRARVEDDQGKKAWTQPVRVP